MHGWVILTPTASCVSADLDHWTRSDFPLALAYDVVATRHGIVAVGAACDSGDCDLRDALPTTAVSMDGLAWTRVDSTAAVSRVTDGPAGVIGIDSVGNVWRLARD
jgi:hypothetical protein